MRNCYLAALAVLSWFVMLPPPIMPPVKDANGNFKVNSTAPMSQWLKLKTYEAEDACKTELKQLQPFYKCVRSDDPALRKTPAAAAGAPSISTVTGAAGSHM
ncbi:MAG TPA: hypothetical protein VGR40_00875 [Candidatus Binatus sp.]|nr:hypothetical protein [Candidatus Binatus sp.]